MTDQPLRLIIAVVDDDQRVLESLGTLLESADHAVRLFASAKALLESRCLAEVDCLISDIDMPRMDGFELLRAVQAARPELPVILITGHPKLAGMSPAGLGRYRLFKKPFDGQELLTAVGEAASVAGQLPEPDQAAYVAAKHGVIGLTKTAALENAHLGIRVNALAPGWVRTPLTRSLEDNKGFFEKMKEAAPMHRGAEPEEMVGTVLLLCSDAASFITGQAFVVDGGQLIRGLVPVESTIPSTLGRYDSGSAARSTSVLQG